MLKAYFSNGNKKTEIAEAMAELLFKVFGPGSAAANVAGIDRAKVAELLPAYLPQMGKFDSIIFDTEDKVITVENKELPAVLIKIAEACRLNDAYRESVKPHNAVYDAIRQEVDKNPSEGKRGRKSESVEDKLAAIFAAK